jgi:6-phosphofructokinase 1
MVNGLMARGGTMLYTARCPEFMTKEGVEKGRDTLKYRGIEGVIGIGGDGTFRGLRDLAECGVATFGIPATIDNDIACTNYSIGFDTACNTAIDAIDKLRDTMQSHERCSVVEVMGRRAGHIAVYVGIAVGANAILVPEHKLDFERDVFEKIRYARNHGNTHFIIIVAEGAGKAIDVAAEIKEHIGMEPRITVLGHIQRGGTPTARDRVTASRMGKHAVDMLMAGKKNRVVGIIDGNLQDFDIFTALDMKRELQDSMYETAVVLSLSR